MGYHVLLSPHDDPLDRLTLSRWQFDASMPAASIETQGDELLLYALVGSVNVYANGLFLGTLGSRRSLKERGVQALRFPVGQGFDIALTLHGTSADLLCVTCVWMDTPLDAPRHPYWHWSDTAWHAVGEGSYERAVAEVPTPDGFAISAGETHNVRGGTSSWPPHANEADLRRFSDQETSWEELMWFCCTESGSVNLQGLYTGNKVVDEIRRVDNGAAMVMPLGSHPITAAPGAEMTYAWFYCGDSLKKVYNASATDVHTYQK